MKTLLLTLSLLSFGAAHAADAPASGAAAQPKQTMHRYMIERTFPKGALDGLDAAGKKKVNATNKANGVRWVMSYANADKTKTFCVYEAPSEAAIRDAAKANAIPVDSVMEVPETLLPK